MEGGRAGSEGSGGGGAGKVTAGAAAIARLSLSAASSRSSDEPKLKSAILSTLPCASSAAPRDDIAHDGTFLFAWS